MAASAVVPPWARNARTPASLALPTRGEVAREDAEDCDCKTVPAAGRSTDTLGVTDLLRDLASSDSDLRLLLSLLGSGESALGSVSG